MKLNKSFVLNTVLTIALSTLTTLSVNAKELGNYTQDHIHGSLTEAKLALAEDSHKKAHSSKNPAQGFISKHTTEMEFTFAILVVIGGIIMSERFSRNEEQIDTDESKEIRH